MQINSKTDDIYLVRTRIAYTWTRILNTPFWAIYTLLPFIMCKDLHATPWQIACIISLSPIVSLFSLYWSALIKRRCDRLVSNIVWANILAHFPFIFIPWIAHPWYLVFASATYMLFYRGANPAWMEILKINIPEQSRKIVFAYGSAFYHVGGALLAIIFGVLMDYYFQAWRWLFPLTVLIAWSALIFQCSLPINFLFTQSISTNKKISLSSLKEQLKKPWVDAWDLIKQRPDFTRFQIGFMLGGGGLMLWKPALPQFFFETLQLNYKELTIAMSLCKSVGYALAVPLWTRMMNHVNIFIFTAIVTATAAIVPFGLMAAQWNIGWLYCSYLLYGVMQTGSELSWNLSGSIFSKKEDSSTYTGVNIVSIGLRGCIIPPLGSFLCNFTNATTVLLIGGGFCFLATWQMYLNGAPKEKPINS